MDEYKIQRKKGQGTYSQVFQAVARKTGKLVAIKLMKANYDSLARIKKDKEIQALKQLASHDNIVKLHDVLFDEPKCKLALVFELMDCNLYEYLKSHKKDLKEAKVRDIGYQILKAVDHMHKKGIFHRDIKPQNILISGNNIKLADFGSCKNQHSQLPYTEYISTRWYRAPECILTDGYYDSKMDIWGVGCVIFELMSKFALFPGKNQIDQIGRIHNIVGTPPKQLLDKFEKHSTHMQFNFPAQKGAGIQGLIPEASSEFVDLVYKLLTYDPEQRITAEEALKHPCFHGLEKIYRARHSQHVRGKSQILPPIGHVMAGKNFSLSKNPREPVLNLSAVYPKKSFKVS